jgi:hypothetical protein
MCIDYEYGLSSPAEFKRGLKDFVNRVNGVKENQKKGHSIKALADEIQKLRSRVHISYLEDKESNEKVKEVQEEMRPQFESFLTANIAILNVVLEKYMRRRPFWEINNVKTVMKTLRDTYKNSNPERDQHVDLKSMSNGCAYVLARCLSKK